jgi:hypothetical protein
MQKSRQEHRMTLEAISGSATVAIASATVFFLASKSWHVIARTLATQPNFPDSIMREAAQRFRDEFERLSRQQSAYIATLVTFVVVFAVAYTFQASALFTGYPAWQLYLVLLALAGALVFAVYRLVRVVSAWREIRFVRDANIAVGHSLQRIASNHGHVYHDVATSAGVVDHVVLGPSGVYAINVVAQRSSKHGAVKVDADRLRFSSRHTTVPLTDIVTKTARLQLDFRQLLRESIRLRLVIAVPGWEVEMRNGDGCLVVNEKTLPMLLGWKSEADCLMNEDVDILQDYLTKNCRRSSSGRKTTNS